MASVAGIRWRHKRRSCLGRAAIAAAVAVELAAGWVVEGESEPILRRFYGLLAEELLAAARGKP